MPVKDPARRAAINRRYYQRNGKAAVVAKTAEYRRRNQEYVDAIKASTPCADCGKTFPAYAMDFDHLDGHDKDRAITDMVHNPVGMERLIAEIAKCEVVCAICHRGRTRLRRHLARVAKSGFAPAS